MVFKRIATVFLWLLVTLTSAFGFMASELEIASSDFFYETIDCAESETPGVRNLCRENGWLNYDTTLGYCVATNKIPTPHGLALQADTKAARAAFGEVQSGATVYRQGSFGVQNTADAQF